MGLAMFVKDGMFYPAVYGLSTGDVVDIVLVGGGNGGYTGILGGSPGSDSYFGTYLKARAGMGAKGGAAFWSSVSVFWAAGGGGGFVPGSNIIGGAGITGVPTGTADLVNTAVTGTNGGGASGYGGRILAGNGNYFGGGTGENGYNNKGEGGAGYGGGGGSWQGGVASNRYAGNAGEILFYSHVLTSDNVTNGIPITIGPGYLPDSVRPYTASATGIKTGIKFIKPILQAPMESNYGTHKTFDLEDGTFGITIGTSVNGNGNWPTATSHVKFIGVNVLRTFASAFPGFVNDFQQPIYYCNGWYVQVNNNTSNQLSTRSLPAAKCKDGTVLVGDLVTTSYSTTANMPMGFKDNDMVWIQNATTMRVYANWTPTSTTYTTATFSQSFVWQNEFSNQSTSNTYLIRSTTGALFPVLLTVTAGIQSSTFQMYYISSYTSSAATVGTIQYAAQIMYYVGKTGWVQRRGYYNSSYNYQSSAITEHRYNILPYAYVMFSFGNTGAPTQCGNNTAGNNYYWGFNIWVCEDDSIGWTQSAYASTESYAYAYYGYNNSPGQTPAPGNTTGGAGGCCMVTF